MARVLIVEDETVLRTSLARGIGKMSGVVVDAAASVDEAIELIDNCAPDLLISDIDLPGRTGIELLGELNKRGISAPIIYVSAYLSAYRAALPRHADIEVVEKPVALDHLRQLILARLPEEPPESVTPFTAPDFLQLASMGRHSVVIDANWPDGRSGSIIAYDGEVWHAQYGELQGVDAFAEVAWRPGATLQCYAPEAERGPRTVTGTIASLLMDTARVLDEQQRDDPSLLLDELLDGGAESSAGTSADSTGQEPSALDGAFEHHLDEGVRALLDKNHEAAFVAFEAAEALVPGHTTVRTNLQRLREMGFGQPAATMATEG